MERYRTILESNAEGTHSAETRFWATAPSSTSPSLAYLTVIPVNYVCELSLVRVLHIIFDVPSLTPHHTVTCGIIGDSKPPLLPIIKQAPPDGLEPYLDEIDAAWPSSERMKEFYKTHSSAELMGKDKADDQYAAIPKLMFVPTTWIGAFLEPIPPKLAYERALWLKKLLPKSSIHFPQIQMIIYWTKCACVRGRGRGNPNSQMMIPWRVLPDDTYVHQCAKERLADMYPRDFPKPTATDPKQVLTTCVKFDLQILRLKGISLFGELRSLEYDPTSIDRCTEGNDWYKIHQETIHKILLLVFSYYQRIHSLSDLREVVTNLLLQDEIKIPEAFLGWTNDSLHTHTEGFYEPDHSDIINIMEQLSVKKVVDECYGDTRITTDGPVAFCWYVPSICEKYRTPMFKTTQREFWDLVVQGFDQDERRVQLNWRTTPQMREAKLPGDQYLG